MQKSLRLPKGGLKTKALLSKVTVGTLVNTPDNMINNQSLIPNE